MIRELRRILGPCLALLALWAQLTTAATVPSAAVSLADVVAFCHHDADGGAPAAPAHHAPDCLLCFCCHNVVGPAGLIAAAPALPAPPSWVIRRAAVLPPATAPPRRVALAARPRGPPLPV